MKSIFKQAIDAVMTSEEIDALIKYTRGRESRSLKTLKKQYPILKETLDGDIPVIVLISMIESANLWRDIICHMLFNAEGKSE